VPDKRCSVVTLRFTESDEGAEPAKRCQSAMHNARGASDGLSSYPNSDHCGVFDI
jgi:hypothetical protein